MPSSEQIALTQILAIRDFCTWFGNMLRAELENVTERAVLDSINTHEPGREREVRRLETFLRWTFSLAAAAFVVTVIGVIATTAAVRSAANFWQR
jgi:hypothetical protein